MGFYGTDPEASDDDRKRKRNVSLSLIQASWEVGSKMIVERLMPYGGTPEDIERLARWIRVSVTSDVAQSLLGVKQDRGDLAPLLAEVSVPTLVIHRRGTTYRSPEGESWLPRFPALDFCRLRDTTIFPATHDEAVELVTPVVEFLANHQNRSQFRPADVSVPLTHLFAEIEGSTVLKRRLGDKGVERLLRAHTDAVLSLIESYNGEEVKHTGHGTGASFFSASRAVGCALQIQHTLAKRNAANPEDAVKVRIGMNVGEPIPGDNNFYDGSAQLAERICKSAEPGQILVSDVVRQLVAGKGFAFEPAGVKMLKGFDEPVALYKLGLGDGL